MHYTREMGVRKTGSGLRNTTQRRVIGTAQTRSLGSCASRGPPTIACVTGHERVVMRSVRTSEVLARHADVCDALTAAERERAAAFRVEQDRQDFVAAHVLVRICAGLLLDRPADDLTIIQRCAVCGRGHGRPRLLEDRTTIVSFAHTRGSVAAAAARRAVGVDVERLDRVAPDDATIAASMSTAEARAIAAAPDVRAAFLRLWVLKEALVKVGALSLDGFSTIDLSAWLDVEAPTTWAGWRLGAWQHDGAIVGQALAVM